jgi:hypothetical protein
MEAKYSSEMLFGYVKAEQTIYPIDHSIPKDEESLEDCMRTNYRNVLNMEKLRKMDTALYNIKMICKWY